MSNETQLVLNAFKKTFGVEVTPNTRLVEELDADSLDMMELVLRLEEQFNTKFDENFINFNLEQKCHKETVQDIIDAMPQGNKQKW